MKRFVIICVLLAIAAGLAASALKHARKDQLNRLTQATEDNRIADNAKRAIGTDVAKFYRAMGSEEKVEIVSKGDGTYFVVSMPLLKVTKAQLEKYAAENTKWIEE